MSERRNEIYITLLESLANIMTNCDEPFRARAYQKAQESLLSCSKDIFTTSDLKGVSGIGKSILEKLKEYDTTGKIELIENEKKNPVNVFMDVYGIGPKKAKELVEKGIQTIPQLRKNQHLLNDVQQVGLNYYEDILERIPRNEIDYYKHFFQLVFTNQKVHANTQMEIVGSYRRGAETSGDIDVIITSKTSTPFTKFIDELFERKIILHILSRGTKKCLVIAKLPNSKFARRVDFLYTPPNEFPFAILYFTGSKIFNTVMRHIALEKGYTMNEHGIYHMVNKKKGEKVEKIFYTEKEIFDFLNIQYKEPEERIDGRSVIII